MRTFKYLIFVLVLSGCASDCGEEKRPSIGIGPAVKVEGVKKERIMRTHGGLFRLGEDAGADQPDAG